MADIELIIKMPEEEYKQLESGYIPSTILDYVVKAKPLPKGHGTLMILSKDKLEENQMNLSFSCQKWISEVGLSNATVAIIEVDEKEQE